MFCFRVIGAHSLRISSGGFKHLKVLFHPKNSSCFVTFKRKGDSDGFGRLQDFQRMYCGEPSVGSRGVELGISVYLRGESTFYWYFAK